ncbi:MAG: DegV family protein [Clostridia bacterium]|nr:DegV family protein [Clostridia bacterium]
MFQLFTDTDTDILPEEAEAFGYKLISMPYAIKDGDTVYPYEDFKIFDYGTFYNTLRDGTLPTTYGLSPVKYMEYFEPTLKEGKDILYVHFSAAMSGTFDSMKLAWQELSQKYPERKLYTVDTKGITILSNNIVKEIGEMALAGASIDEIMLWAEKEVDKFAVYFYADDLKFFARSGRVSGLSAVFGGILGIRPIININSDGIMKSVTKAKGRHGAMNKLLEYVDNLQEDIKDHRVIIGHADAYDLAAEMEELLKEKYGNDLRTEIVVVNPTAGSHCGPDTVGVCFHAKQR